jgi:hypothetical protein
MKMVNQKFPQVSGSNLLRENVSLPGDLSAAYNLLLIAFYQPQQDDINTWLPYAKKLESDRPDFTYFELPVIRSLNPLARWFINEGMRAGIGDREALARTVTLYLDKNEFRNTLGIVNENTIHILLVHRTGEILWQTTGRYSEEKHDALIEQMNTKYLIEER